MVDLSEQELQSLYAWIDEVPLSRPKKSIARDFSDGVMAAEIVYHFFPKIVELHNYTAASSTSQKIENWRLLNRKVFMKLDLNVSDDLLNSVVACKPGIIEYILNHLKTKIESIQTSASGDFNPILAELSNTSQPQQPHYHFNSTAGNTVANQMQDNRHPAILSPSHQMISPSHQSLQPQSSVNHLPPLVKSPMAAAPPSSGLHAAAMTHPIKHSKPSHIPRPAHSSSSSTSRQALPPINSSQGGGGGQMNGSVIWNSTSTQSKLPVIKDRTKSIKGIPAKASKRDINYASQHLGVPHHWFRKPSNPKDGGGGAGGLSKEGMLVMAEKDQMIMELQETVQLLQMKVKRLEHLIKIKDYKLQDIEKHSSVTGAGGGANKTGPPLR